MFGESPIGLLLNRERLRTIRLAFGLDPEAFAVDTDRDPELIDLLEDPFESVDDVYDRFSTLETSLIERDDRRAVFSTIYTEMTDETREAIDAGEFRDPDWMRTYVVRFADYYRRAFLDFERGAIDDVPDPWVIAFGTAIDRDALVIQHAFLGINAHISYDLALTLSDIGIDPDRADKYADHRRINEVLERLVAVQQELLAELYAPGLERVGASLGSLDERFSAFVLARARASAWRTAVVRTDASLVPVESYTKWYLRTTATGGASVLLSPKASPSLLRALHAIEADELPLRAFSSAFHDLARRQR